MMLVNSEREAVLEGTVSKMEVASRTGAADIARLDFVTCSHPRAHVYPPLNSALIVLSIVPRARALRVFLFEFNLDIK